ncbi:flagellar basal-body MS-ring/collar protein FliF [Buchnera aphidicola]|uniref:flagellar basal-body MS-ring/collar protein FliF n=1 Tax=Buchnera aphidicola TaxID=9 RepID=UPI0031B73EAF
MNFKNLLFKDVKKKYNYLMNYFFKNYQVFFIFFSGICAIIFSIIFWIRSENYKILYDSISRIEGSEIIKKLTRMKIPYKLDEKTGSILVPEKKIQEIKFKLAYKKNFFKKNNGFEILDKEKFGISAFNEKINYNRSLEGELARTLQILYPIKNVRIHLSIPQESSFLHTNHNNISASILLFLDSKIKLDFLQIESLVHFVAFSVPNLTCDKIVIMDQFGNMLNTIVPNLKDNYFFHFLELYNQQLEKKIKTSITQLLTPILGIKNFIVQVTVQQLENLSFNQQKKDRVLYTKDNNSLLKLVPEYFNELGISSNSDFFSSKMKKKIFFKKKEKLPIEQKKKKIKKSVNTIVKNKKKNTKLNKRKDYKYHILKSKNIFFNGKKSISIVIILNYYKNLKGELVSFTSTELNNFKFLIKSSLPFLSNYQNTIRVFNQLFIISQKNISKNIFFRIWNIFFIKKNFLYYFLFFLFFLIFCIKYKINKIFQYIFKKYCLIKIFNINKKPFLISQKDFQKNSLQKLNNNKNSNFIISNIRKKILNMSAKTIAKIIRIWFKKMEN